MEEQLASDIEEAHIVCLQKKAMQESIPVLVVSRKLMAAYLEQFSQFSLPIYQMVPDSSLIPDVTEKRRGDIDPSGRACCSYQKRTTPLEATEVGVESVYRAYPF